MLLVAGDVTDRQLARRAGLCVLAAPAYTLLPAARAEAAQVSAAAAAELATGWILAGLGRDWTVLHGRWLPLDGQLVAHLLVGPPGVVVLETLPAAVAVTAQLWLSEDDEVCSRYLVDGDPVAAAAVTWPAASAARAVREVTFGYPLPVHAAVVAHAAAMPAPWVTVPGEDPGRGGGGSVTVVAGARLLDWLTALPAVAPDPGGRRLRAVGQVYARVFRPATR